MAKAIARGEKGYNVPGKAMPGEEAEAVLELEQVRHDLSDLIQIQIDQGDRAKGVAEIEELRTWVNQQLATPTVSNGTLHEALRAWGDHLKGLSDPSGHFKKCGEGVQRFLDHHADVPLADLGEAETMNLLRYWANRPVGKRGPLSLASCQWHLKRMREFFRWLSRSSFGWRKPADFGEWRVSIRDTADDYSLEHPTFTVEELAKLYQCASPLVRSWILLGLNCGFKFAEISSLTRNDLNFTTGVIQRIRRKSKVPAQWLLWSETQEALQWAVTRSEKIGEKSLVFVSEMGRSYDSKTAGGNKSGRMANLWNATLEKAGVRKLSFKHLEKTSSTWLRAHYSGELASMFISHGRPVRADPLLEAYANKPWQRLGEALTAWRKALERMFDEEQKGEEDSR